MIAGRRALPEIPVTATTSTTPSQQQTTFQTWSSTLFDDDGHYTDIHSTVVSGGGAARIPTWRRSFVDDPDHYNYLEFNQLTSNNGAVEQRQRSSAGDEDVLRQRSPVYNYTSNGSDELRSRMDPEGYLEPVEVFENENHRSLEERPSRRRDHIASRPEEDEVNRQGYEGLDPSVVEELLRPPRPHSYAGIYTSSTSTDRPHSYLEVIGYSGTNNVEGAGMAAEGYQCLDPAEVEELPRRPHSYAGADTSSTPTNRPHSYMEVIGYSGTDNVEDTGMAAEHYQGLDPAVVEELRRRANIPHEYAGLSGGQGEVTERGG